MPAELLPDRVADCLRTLHQDRHEFRNGLEETAKAVALSRKLIAQSQELLRRVEKTWESDPPQEVPFQATGLRQPVCVDCQLPMQIVASQVYTANNLLRHVLFACDCGRTVGQVIVQADQ